VDSADEDEGEADEQEDSSEYDDDTNEYIDRHDFYKTADNGKHTTAPSGYALRKKTKARLMR